MVNGKSILHITIYASSNSHCLNDRNHYWTNYLLIVHRINYQLPEFFLLWAWSFSTNLFMINKFFIEFYMLKCNSFIFVYIVLKMLGLKNQQVLRLVCCIVIIVSNFFYICLIFIENILRKVVIYIVSIKLYFYVP